MDVFLRGDMSGLRRAIVRAACVVLCVCIFFGLVPAQVSAAGRPAVRVGVFDLAGYYGTGEDGVPNGYGRAYTDAISKTSGLRFEFVEGTLVECLERLERGEIDIIDGIQYTKERADTFLYSQYSTGTSFGKLYARANDGRLAFNNFASFEGMHVGMLRGSNLDIGFGKFADKNQFSVKEVMYDSVEGMQKALNAGEVDAIVLNNLRKLEEMKAIACFDPAPFYMITSPDKAELMEKINNALEEIQVVNPSFNAELLNRYFSSVESVLALTQSELDYVSKHEPITVVYDSNWAPFESYDKKTDGPVGINVDIIKQVEEKTGLTFEFLDGYNYDQAIEMVSAGEVDMLLSYDTNPQEARGLGVLLSNTFLETPIAIIGEDYVVQPDSVFAIPEIYPMHLAYIRENFPDNEVIVLPDIEACYAALMSGKVDFTAENIYAANQVIQSGMYGSLVVASVTTLLDKFSFVFKAGTDYALISLFDKTIATISAEDKDVLLLSNATNAGTDQGIGLFFKRYRLPIMVVMGALGVVTIAALCFIIAQQRKNRKAFWKMAYIDTLTGLPNLKRFMLDAPKMVQANPDTHYAVAILDICKFNLINEIYGFEEGDRVIQVMKEGLVRQMNPQTDLMARMHADHFIMLMAYDLLPDGQAAVINKQKNKEFDLYVNEHLGHRFRYSVGRYFLKLGECDMHSIFEKVNYAHNVAKKNTVMGQFYDYDDNMKKQAVRHREIESKMETALQNNEFMVYLQPKYRLEDERLTGAEALVRWQEEDGQDVVYPSEFIPLFEENGFIVKLDMYMFERACEIIGGWMKAEAPLTTISVNFSRLHLQNPEFVPEIIEIASAHAVPKKYLEIELTESAMFDNEAVLEEVLTKLHHAGFTLSMDDFGTGYSSLGLLKNLPVDVIKMDRTFFTNNRYKTRAKTVIESVVKMAKDLGIHTVAEGVETIEYIEFLREIGCESVQGYYYARPMPAEHFSTQSVLVPPEVGAKAHQLNLAFLGDIVAGRKDLGTDMPVMVYRLMEFSMREALSNLYGEGEMQEALHSSGKIAGRVFAAELLDETLPFEDFIAQLSEKLEELKIGILRVEHFEKETGAAVITVSGDAGCSGVYNGGKAMCSYDEGFISGVFYEYTKKNYSVLEIDCWGTGAQLCRFEVKPS